jgi:NAD-dependent deacetylase
MDAAEQCDVLLAVGTSLQVYPIAGAVPLATAAGARLIIVNAQPTPFDDLADLVLREPIGTILPAICDAGQPDMRAPSGRVANQG